MPPKPPPKPMHPLAAEALRVGLTMGARAAARAFDSLLKDVEIGLGEAAEKVRGGRKNLRRKVKASGVPLKDPPRYDVEDDEEDGPSSEEEE
jgi:hypothetical protein